MGTVVWYGGALAVDQESRATPANPNTGDIYYLICAGEQVEFTVAATETVAAVTAGLASAWNASTVSAHTEVTATDQTTYLELLSDTAGVSFTVTSNVFDGSGGAAPTLTMSTPTANAGPNVWDTPANWDTGSVPVAADDVVLENSSISIFYGLAQSAVTLDSLTVRASFIAQLGLPRTNSAGNYVEYRDTYLAIGATALDIGTGEGSGSGRIKIDTGSVQTTINVRKTSTSLDSTLGAVIWKGTHASNTITITSGTVSVAPFAGETAAIATLENYLDAVVDCGSGTTLTTVDVAGGQVTAFSNITTLTLAGGLFILDGAATLTTVNMDGGELRYLSTGTLTTANVGGGSTLNFSRDLQNRTVTNCNVYSGATISDPYKTVTFTNGLDLIRSSIQNVSLDVGSNQTLSLSAI